jgi:hypothetical protein
MEHDPGSQNRFTALRAFEIHTCVASTQNLNCSAPPLGYSKVFTSQPDAFPSTAPRPVQPDLLIRSFDVPDGPGTHVMILVLTNQCTGGPDFAGEQDDDPLNATDCALASAAADDVRIAELQVFGK